MSVRNSPKIHDRHDLPSIPASLQTLGRCECAAASALASFSGASEPEISAAAAEGWGDGGMWEGRRIEVEGSEGMGATLGGGEDVGRRGEEWRFGAQESRFDAQVKRESQRERMRERDKEREREQKRMVSEQLRQQLRVRPSSDLRGWGRNP